MLDRHIDGIFLQITRFENDFDKINLDNKVEAQKQMELLKNELLELKRNVKKLKNWELL
jgi:archaellum component FlaC